jgi:hypothetical protein
MENKQWKVGQDSINQLIKGKTGKDTSDMGETDDVKEGTLLHAELLVALEAALCDTTQQKEATPNDVLLPSR